MARILLPQDKTKIYDFLADAYIELVRQKSIGPFERKIVAKKILEAVEKASNFEDVHSFVAHLADTYEFFKPAAVRVKGEIEQLQEEKVIDQLSKYISNFPSKKS